MRIRIKHLTRYEYPKGVAFGPHLVRLRPAANTRAEIMSYNLEIRPAEHEIRWQQDPWSNQIARLTFPADKSFDELSFEVDLSLDIRPVNPFDFYIDDRCDKVPFRYPDQFDVELAPYLQLPAIGPRLAEFIEKVPFEGHAVDYLVALNQAVARRVDYIIRNEPGIQTSEETLTVGRGSCRDSAQLLVDVLRARGLAARFVSGYLVQLADEGIIPDEAKGVDQDVVDLHAWAEVYLPGGGWVGLDGTSGLLCGEGHVPLASAVTPALAAPIDGTASQPATGFNFEMSVTRLGHEPRPRKPYEDQAWADILAAGRVTDQALIDRGLGLTCGGEPTWTSRLHPDLPEWKTEAVGETKWQQGTKLLSEIKGRVGEGTLTMVRMGKLYPGESLPRWNIDLLWRTDGVPIWRDQTRLRCPDRPAGTRELPGNRQLQLAAYDRASALAAELVKRLAVDPEHLYPAYEDPWPAFFDEGNLPPDVEVMNADVDDPEKRRRLAALLERGLQNPVGLVLPLTSTGLGWVSSAWTIRRPRLFLIPGDSPIGLRLPLESLGGKPLELFNEDLTVPGGPLRYDPRISQWQGGAPDEFARATSVGPDDVLYTALCVEPRDGVINVFLPPLETTDAFMRLVAAIEDSCSALSEVVNIEGYKPAADPRLRHYAITPDPGVIEVNLPVSESFAEYLAQMELVSDAANHSGLTAEKYQLDGREVGSGGGNHITLGGHSAAESPFLQDPHLLGSLLRYLQHHPSLSYLFTGMFVGPTSQAPRLDEARHDSLYELELALEQLPVSGPIMPWHVDRVLRNLLVDVAGNTHRTEICIDKLYAPGGLAGRQGLIELRAFEMPPHERMAAVQMLLARGLVARMAHEPYEGRLVRWGSQLHDRFMLPHYLWRDICDVARDLQDHGVPFDAEWFRPFVDYRFPVFGRFLRDDIQLEIRTALEPWPTLGEEAIGPLVARHVDSSLERVQVTVRGMVEGRYAVGVNGIELPLTPTGTAGESVAGVRFRAWQPPHCLQPTIPAHHPLRFDIVDRWGKRALGACTYHVWHPQGHAFNEPPLTPFEAAARRAQRFTTLGHTPYPVELLPAAPAPEQPLTLDLRRYPGASRR